MKKYNIRSNHILFIIFLILFFLLWFFMATKRIEWFDKTIIDLVKQTKSPFMTNFAKTITVLANAFPILLFSFIFLAIKKKEGMYTLFTITIATILNVVLKNLISRERPTKPWLIDEVGYSFPSGHAMASMALYGMLIYFSFINIKNKYLKWGSIITLSLLILGIGFSRIYLGVHYPSDVLAGYALSLCIVLIFSTYYQKNMR